MNISDHITQVSGLQYFVAMIDYGKGPARPNGFSADVAPEYTRRQIVEDVRNCIESGHKIVHVKFIDGNDMTDVTHEIVGEAINAQAEYEAEMRGIDAINNRICADRDRARSYRNEVV